MVDPIPSGSALVAAVLWAQGLALGALATGVAVLAVAWVGLLALQGRMAVRRGGGVLLGCFVLFGAPTLAAGLEQLATGFAPATAPGPPADAIGAIAPSAPAQVPDPAFDPYAGAAVRPR